jgi:hypothetical protein
MSSTSASVPIAARLVLVGAFLSTPIYYFVIRSQVFYQWTPLLHFIGVAAGCVGFIGLLIWNALLTRKSFIGINTFFTIWMFLYFSLMLTKG